MRDFKIKIVSPHPQYKIIQLEFNDNGFYIDNKLIGTQLVYDGIDGSYVSSMKNKGE